VQILGDNFRRYPYGTSFASYVGILNAEAPMSSLLKIVTMLSLLLTISSAFAMTEEEVNKFDCTETISEMQAKDIVINSTEKVYRDTLTICSAQEVVAKKYNLRNGLAELAARWNFLFLMSTSLHSNK
jgi:hypothetical protein